MDGCHTYHCTCFTAAIKGLDQRPAGRTPHRPRAQAAPPRPGPQAPGESEGSRSPMAAALPSGGCFLPGAAIAQLFYWQLRAVRQGSPAPLSTSSEGPTT